MSRIEKDYSEIKLTKFTKEEIKNYLNIFNDKYLEAHYFDDCQLRKVKEPFILADNDFDLMESNNFTFTTNVIETEIGSFTGGCLYQIFVKDDKSKDSYIFHGNDDEGYNLFEIEN